MAHVCPHAHPFFLWVDMETETTPVWMAAPYQLPQPLILLCANARLCSFQTVSHRGRYLRCIGDHPG